MSTTFRTPATSTSPLGLAGRSSLAESRPLLQTSEHYVSCRMKMTKSFLAAFGIGPQRPEEPEQGFPLGALRVDFKDVGRGGAFLPVNSLPVEILREVFMLVAKSDAFGRARITLTHVCQRWRVVALDLAPLWAYIRSGYDRSLCFSAFLKRSKNAPLYVSFDSTLGKLDIDAMERTSGHVGRFGALTLIGRPGKLGKFLSMLTKPAPMLKELTVRAQPALIHGPPIIFEPKFLGRCPPALRKLEISSSEIFWTDLVLLNPARLVSLHLLNKGRNLPHGSPSIVLRQCSLLQSLKLLGALLPISVDPVILPQLECLELIDYRENCASFLKTLSIPVIRRIKIHLRSKSFLFNAFVPPEDIIAALQSLVQISGNTLKFFALHYRLADRSFAAMEATRSHVRVYNVRNDFVDESIRGWHT